MVGDILQPTHLLLILVVALLVLGPKRLPEVGRTLGNGIRDFRAAINGEGEHHDELGGHRLDAPPDLGPRPTAQDADAQPVVHETTVPTAEPELTAHPEPAAVGEHERAGSGDEPGSDRVEPVA